MKNETNEKAVPFFARFLEDQASPDIKPGMTLKYPSDRDEQDYS
jgi:hypothetical protein